VDVVLETVGGARLVEAWSLLKPGGDLQSIGCASGEPAVFPPDSIFTLGAARSLRSFGDVADPGLDLAFLTGLAARGELSPEIGWRGSWEGIAEAADALFGRRVAARSCWTSPRGRIDALSRTVDSGGRRALRSGRTRRPADRLDADALAPHRAGGRRRPPSARPRTHSRCAAREGGGPSCSIPP
jgi:hypothetical protein